eukprot:CAMPEP_0173226624 /NCGR_PEP_ID=MMETSP1142-20121109/5534_1 /TAXON_ID=483371 /ORGANISM="non described non described, Strain CCMP2298" /LENGTH=206 /DNA_ID=CAMNT_0014155095 /DNA_START=224 /DNA_END=844 /DNA_ORIENTATION=-
MKDLAPLRLQVAGGSARETCDIVLPRPVAESVSIPCRLTLTSETLLGPETLLLDTELSVSLCAAFAPLRLTEGPFASALGAPSPRWGSASASVPCSARPRHAFKALGGFLRAHLVEDTGQAASLAATAPQGCVYFLAKAGAGAVRVEIRCLCGDAQESARTAALVAGALGDLFMVYLPSVYDQRSTDASVNPSYTIMCIKPTPCIL